MRGLLVAGEGRRIRAGMVATVAGGPRLLTASGANAAALIATLARPGGRAGEPLSGDRALAAGLAQLTGPAALVVRGADPVRASALSLDGPARGLIASGLVLAAEPLLSGAAPGASACASASLFCARAGLGPAGREALALAARAYLGALLGSAAQEPDRLAQRAAAAAERVVVRSDGADARLLSSDREALWALRLQAVTAPPGSGGAADAQGPPASPVACAPDGRREREGFAEGRAARRDLLRGAERAAGGHGAARQARRARRPGGAGRRRRAHREAARGGEAHRARARRAAARSGQLRRAGQVQGPPLRRLRHAEEKDPRRRRGHRLRHGGGTAGVRLRAGLHRLRRVALRRLRGADLQGDGSGRLHRLPGDPPS